MVTYRFGAGMDIGYARVSTTKHDLGQQLAKSEDVIVVYTSDQLGSTVRDILNMIH